MYTSDGWYFDELSRPEPLQVMQYGGRVIELAQELFDDRIEEKFLSILEQAKSNIPAQGDGRHIFENLVRPAMLWAKAGVSYDDQRKTLDSMVVSAVEGLEKSFRPLFEELYPPERFSAELGGPLPRAFQVTEALIINNALHRAIGAWPVDINKVRELLDTAGKWQVQLDEGGIGYGFRITLEKTMAALAADPSGLNLESLLAAVSLARGLPFAIDLWKVQNIFWDMMKKTYPEFKNKAERGDRQAQGWVVDFIALGSLLSIRAG
jgi:hypothetical protein